MYYDYFGLKQPPFKITPDTSLFFPGGDRGAILDALIYAIVSGEGIVKLVGEVGSGKTTLCRMLEKELPENVEIVYLANPSLSPDNILHAIAFELNLNVKPDDSRLKVMNTLQNYLLERHAENKQIVVFVEEAQSMPIATLEEIRLLSNLETAQNKLLQIMIFGQPELDAMIARPEIRQLKERITYSFYLSPFKPDEVKDYINSRLRACGYRSVELFSDKAIKTISKYSNGLLRRINILADKSLLACYADNANVVSVKHVELAARETEFVDTQNKPFFRWGLAGFSIVVAVAFIALFIETMPPSIPEKTNALEQNNPVEVIENTELSESTVTPTLKEKKEISMTEVKTVETVTTGAIAGKEESTDSDIAVDKEQMQEAVKIVTPEILVEIPDPDEIQQAEWQSIEENVFYYPDEPLDYTPKYDQPNKLLIDNNLVDIQDMMHTLKEHGEDDIALLNQLTKLPSETAINHNAVANELTCKLCSTIIYRPLKDDKKL